MKKLWKCVSFCLQQPKDVWPQGGCRYVTGLHCSLLLLLENLRAPWLDLSALSSPRSFQGFLSPFHTPVHSQAAVELSGSF